MKGNFVLLRAGRLRLVLPQDDVGAARYVEAGAGEECLSLSEAMTLLPARPAGRFIAAEFTGAHAGTVWCWDELRVLIDAELQPVAVPRSLLGEETPVHAYVEIDGHIAYLCGAAAICRYALAERV